MSMLRTLNQIENGTISSAQLDTLLADSSALDFSSYMVGQYFPSKGGYYSGFINVSSTQRFLYFAAPVATGQSTSIQWGNYGVKTALTNLGSYTDLTSLDALTNNGDLAYDGKYITENYLNSSTYPAGNLGASLSITIGSNTFNDYFLPSIHELYMMYKNKTIFNTNCPVAEQWNTSNYYWSSTEYYTITNAWGLYFYGGTLYTSNKGTNAFARVVRKYALAI